MKKQFVIIAFGKKQKAWNANFFFFYLKTCFFGTGAKSSILKKKKRALTNGPLIYRSLQELGAWDALLVATAIVTRFSASHILVSNF